MIYIKTLSNIVVKEGDIYVATKDISTRFKHDIRIGYEIEVLSKTNESINNELGPNGYNWIVRSYYGDTIWSTLESCIERGLFKKKE